MGKQPAKNPTGDCETSLLKMRFEYAWRWFEFHARQRTTLLNFFLIIVGVFFAAYGTLLQARGDHPGSVPAIIIFILLLTGAFATVLFFLLDIRNRTLVHLAEDVLENLEENHIFRKDDQTLQNTTDPLEHVSILVRERSEKGKAANASRLRLGGRWRVSEHSVVLTLLYWCILAVFLVLMLVERGSFSWFGAPSTGVDVHTTVKQSHENVDQLHQEIQDLRQIVIEAEDAIDHVDKVMTRTLKLPENPKSATNGAQSAVEKPETATQETQNAAEATPGNALEPENR